jgi:hypothetical protein
MAESSRLSKDPRNLGVSALFSVTYLAMIASVLYFYWGIGLELGGAQWTFTSLPSGLVFIGVLAVLVTSWGHASEAFAGSRFTRALDRLLIGKVPFPKLLGWEAVSATYLLANLGLTQPWLLSLISPLCIWQDCVFYAFVISQLVSSFCVAIVTFIIERFS